MNYSIEHGNIIDYSTSAIVLPANSLLKEGPGTSKAIFTAAGRKQLTKACAELGETKVGTAVPTPSYKLDSDCIIHAVVPKWIDGNHEEYGLLSSAYLSALTLADVMKCKSIAFPLLSAGNNKFDKGLALKIAVDSISAFEGKYLEEVKIVILTEEMVVYIRSQGFDVGESEAIRQKKEQKERLKQGAYKAMNKGKEAAEEVMKAALNYLKDPEVQKKIFANGLDIALNVLKEALMK